jgi:hypothetical protein
MKLFFVAIITIAMTAMALAVEFESPCPKDKKPVCGTARIGQTNSEPPHPIFGAPRTYGNMCLLHQANARYIHEGPCHADE